MELGFLVPCARIRLRLTGELRALVLLYWLIVWGTGVGEMLALVRRLRRRRSTILGLLFLRICVRPLVERMAAWGSIRLLSSTVGTAFE